MINQVIFVVRKFFPMQIRFVAWDGNVLTLSGSNWSFSTLSAWRVLNDTAIEYACWDSRVEGKLNELKGKSITGISKQGLAIAVDPVFELSTGKKLEIFSADTFEPWVLKLPDGQIFTGALEVSNNRIVKKAA
ncbi:MAG: hypothetical protein GY862_05225 [Gammaproteobacteria bacterium]|nr:hypothetical protein [Gammaproteobacteria bacterium]